MQNLKWYDKIVVGLISIVGISEGLAKVLNFDILGKILPGQWIPWIYGAVTIASVYAIATVAGLRKK